MRAMDRRTFLKGVAATTGVAALGGPFEGFVQLASAASGKPSFRGLRAVPDQRDGKERLWLPEGFAYRSFHDTETRVVLDDGTVLPGRHDGMGAFKGRRGAVVLVRNHEINGPGAAFGDPARAYDPMARGGTTTVEATRTGRVLRAYTSCNGTMMNCSGGRMPWGSWVTCEETVNGPDVGPDFTGVSNVPLTKPHGFIFEVPAYRAVRAEPITAAGRFAHEAVAWDPYGGHLYLTEDDFGFPSGFYRYRPRRNPRRAGRLGDGGRLQMLAVVGRPNLDLGAEQQA